MASIDVTINGRSYTVSCDDGQEGRLRQLARYLDMQVTRLAEELGQVGETRLMLMAGLVIADELSEALERLKSLEERVGGLEADRDHVSGKLEAVELRAAHALEGAANRIEILTRRLDTTADEA